MVQIIQRSPQQPRRNFGEEIIGTLEQASNLHRQNQLQSQQRQAITERFGDEIANLPPELQKVAVSELLKSQGKESLLKQKTDLLGGLFGQNKSSFGNQIQNKGALEQGKTDQMQSNQGFDASQIPDEAIAQAAAIDPNIARSLQHAKDVALRDKREMERINLQKEKLSPEHVRKQHVASSQAQADVKYNQQVQENAKQLELKEKSLNRLRTIK